MKVGRVFLYWGELVNLSKYLNDSRNSVVREKIVNYRFYYETKLAGARCGQDIKVSLPEIDRDGYDVVLDDGETIRALQLKTLSFASSTKSWKVQKQLLRPDRGMGKLLGFDDSPHGVGLQGGVVLIQIDYDHITIKRLEYYYCDIFILKAFECGLLIPRNRNNHNANIKILQRLHTGGRNEKLRVGKSAFVRAKSIEKLLTLANLSTKSENYWRTSFQEYLKQNQPPEDRSHVSARLRELIDDSNVVI